MDEAMTPEQILIADRILTEVGEGNSFQYEGDTYTVLPGALKKLRELVNSQLEEAISDD